MKRIATTLLLLALAAAPARASALEGLTFRLGVRGGLYSELELQTGQHGRFVDLVLGVFNTRERSNEFFILPMLHLSRGGLVSYDEIAIATGVDSYSTAGGPPSGSSFAFTVGLASIRGDTIRDDAGAGLAEPGSAFAFKDQTVTTYGVIAERFAAFAAAPRLFHNFFLELQGLRAEGSTLPDVEPLTEPALRRSSRLVQIKIGVGVFYPF